MTDRMPPQNLDMEQSVLGAMLISADALDKATELLSGKDFYREDHRQAFDAMLCLYKRHEPVDIITACTEIARLTGSENMPLIRQMLSNFVNSVVTPSNVEHYAKEVREKAIRRRLIDAASRIYTLAFEDDTCLDAVLAEVEEQVTAATVMQGSSNAEGMVSLISNAFEEIERWSDEKRMVTGIPTGLDDLDFITRGWQPENLIVIGARPAQGKTALGCHFAITAAKARKSVFIASQEMSKRAITLRLIQSLGRIDGHRMRTGRLSDDDWRRVGSTCSQLSGFPITVAERQMGLAHLRAECRRVARSGLDMVVVDYLQLMKTEGRKENRTNEVSALAEGLADLAVELKVPIIALSQLSRAVDVRPGHRPVLQDLRDSGQVEAAADVVLFPFNPLAYEPEDKRSNCEEMEIIVAKQRDGMVGSAKVLWFREYTSFGSPAKEYPTLQTTMQPHIATAMTAHRVDLDGPEEPVGRFMEGARE